MKCNWFRKQKTKQKKKQCTPLHMSSDWLFTGVFFQQTFWKSSVVCTWRLSDLRVFQPLHYLKPTHWHLSLDKVSQNPGGVLLQGQAGPATAYQGLLIIPTTTVSKPFGGLLSALVTSGDDCCPGEPAPIEPLSLLLHSVPQLLCEA